MLGLKDISRRIQGPLTYKSLQLGNHSYRSQAALSRISTLRSGLLPLLGGEYTYESSNRIALCFERYVKNTKNFIKETPGFVSELRAQITYLHNFNKKIAENSLRYPFTYAFEQLLLRYIVLECKVLYKQVNYSQEAEQQVENRILRLLLHIYDAYLRKRLVPADKIFGESAKAIINLCVQLRNTYDVNHKVIENIVVKLLSKSGQLEDALSLTRKRLPCSMDSYLKDTSAIDIYKKITSSDYINNGNRCCQEDNDEVMKIENREKQEKQVNDENVAVKLEQELEQLKKQIEKTKGILTICLDEDSDDEIIYREKAAPTNGSHRQRKKRRNRYEALANLKPIVIDPAPTDEVKQEVESKSPFSDDDKDRVGNVNSIVQNRVSDAFKFWDDGESDDDVVIVEEDCQKVIESSPRIDAIPSNYILSIKGENGTASTVVNERISSQGKDLIAITTTEAASEKDNETSKSDSSIGTTATSVDKPNKLQSIDGSHISNSNKHSEHDVIVVDDEQNSKDNQEHDIKVKLEVEGDKKNSSTDNLSHLGSATTDSTAVEKDVLLNDTIEETVLEDNQEHNIKITSEVEDHKKNSSDDNLPRLGDATTDSTAVEKDVSLNDTIEETALEDKQEHNIKVTSEIEDHKKNSSDDNLPHLGSATTDSTAVEEDVSLNDTIEETALEDNQEHNIKVTLEVKGDKKNSSNDNLSHLGSATTDSTAVEEDVSLNDTIEETALEDNQEHNIKVTLEVKGDKKNSSNDNLSHLGSATTYSTAVEKDFSLNDTIEETALEDNQENNIKVTLEVEGDKKNSSNDNLSHLGSATTDSTAVEKDISLNDTIEEIALEDKQEHNIKVTLEVEGDKKNSSNDNLSHFGGATTDSTAVEKDISLNDTIEEIALEDKLEHNRKVTLGVEGDKKNSSNDNLSHLGRATTDSTAVEKDVSLNETIEETALEDKLEQTIKVTLEVEDNSQTSLEIQSDKKNSNDDNLSHLGGATIGSTSVEKDVSPNETTEESDLEDNQKHNKHVSLEVECDKKNSSDDNLPHLGSDSTAVKRNFTLNENIEEIVLEDNQENNIQVTLEVEGDKKNDLSNLGGVTTDPTVEEKDITLNETIEEIASEDNQEHDLQTTLEIKGDKKKSSNDNLSHLGSVTIGSNTVKKDGLLDEPIETIVLDDDHEDSLKNDTSGAGSAVQDKVLDINVPHSSPSNIISSEQETSVEDIATTETVDDLEETNLNGEYSHPEIRTHVVKEVSKNTAIQTVSGQVGADPDLKDINDTIELSVNSEPAMGSENTCEQIVNESDKTLKGNNLPVVSVSNETEMARQNTIDQSTNTLESNSCDIINEPRETVNEAEASYVDFPLYQDYTDIPATENDHTANEARENLRGGIEIYGTEDTTSNNKSTQEVVEIRNSKAFFYEAQNDTANDESVRIETATDDLSIEQAMVELEETIKGGVEVSYVKPSIQTECQNVTVLNSSAEKPVEKQTCSRTKSVVEKIADEFSEEEEDVNICLPKTAEIPQVDSNKASENLRVTRSKDIADNTHIDTPVETVHRQTRSRAKSLVEKTAVDFSEGQDLISIENGGVPIKIRQETTAPKQTRNSRSKSMAVHKVTVSENNNSTVDTENCKSIAVTDETESSSRVMRSRSKSNMVEKISDEAKRLECDTNQDSIRLSQTESGYKSLVTELPDLQPKNDSVPVAQETVSPRQTRSKAKSVAAVMVEKIAEEYSSEEIGNSDVTTTVGKNEDQESSGAIQMTTRYGSKDIVAEKSSEEKDSIVIEIKDVATKVEKNMDQGSASPIQMTTRSRSKDIVAKKTFRKNVDQETTSDTQMTTRSRSKDIISDKLDISSLQDNSLSSIRPTSNSNCRTTRNRSKSIFLEKSCDVNETEALISQENMRTEDGTAAVRDIPKNNTELESAKEAMTETSVVIPDHIDISDSPGEKSDECSQDMTNDDPLKQTDRTVIKTNTPTLYNCTSEYKRTPAKGTQEKSKKILVHSVVLIASPKKPIKNETHSFSGKLQIAKELNFTTQDLALKIDDSENVFKESTSSISIPQIVDNNPCEANSQSSVAKQVLPKNLTSVDYQKEMMRKVQLFVKLERSKIINSENMKCMSKVTDVIRRSDLKMNAATSNAMQQSHIIDKGTVSNEKSIEDDKSTGGEIFDTEKSCTGCTEILECIDKSDIEQTTEDDFNEKDKVHIEETITVSDTEKGISHEIRTNDETEGFGDKIVNEKADEELKEEINICQAEETNLESKTVEYSEAEVEYFEEPVYETLDTLEPVVHQLNSAIEKFDQPDVQLESPPVFEDISVSKEVEVIKETASKDEGSVSTKDVFDYQPPSAVTTQESDTENFVEEDSFLPVDDLNVHKEEIIPLESDEIETSEPVTTIAPYHRPKATMIVLACVASAVLEQEQQPESKKKVIVEKKTPANIKQKKSLMNQSKRVGRSAAHKPAELHFKPDDFLPRNTTFVAPANNVYVHKTAEVNVTSEESNDSETNNLQIDEGVDIKDLPAVNKEEGISSIDTVEEVNQEKDPLAIYDEDSLEENLGSATVFRSIPETPVTVNEDVLESHTFENRLTDVQEPISSQTGNSEITISEAKDSECEKGQEIEEYPTSVQKLGSVSSEQVSLPHKVCTRPIRNKAERKLLNPYVNIERMNDMFQYTESPAKIETDPDADMDEIPLMERLQLAEVTKKVQNEETEVNILPQSVVPEPVNPVQIAPKKKIMNQCKQDPNLIETLNPKTTEESPNKKYYTVPKLRRKSMSKANLDRAADDSDISVKPIEILSNCKSTISPTTEKLKKKLEYDGLHLDDLLESPKASRSRTQQERIGVNSLHKNKKIFGGCPSSVEKISGMNVYDFDAQAEDFEESSKTKYRRFKSRQSKSHSISKDIYSTTDAEDSQEEILNVAKNSLNKKLPKTEKKSTENIDTNKKKRGRPRSKSVAVDKLDAGIELATNQAFERVMRSQSQSITVEKQTHIEMNEICIENRNVEKITTPTTQPDPEKGFNSPFDGNKAKVWPEEIDRIINKYTSMDLGLNSTVNIEISSNESIPITHAINVHKMPYSAKQSYKSNLKLMKTEESVTTPRKRGRPRKYKTSLNETNEELNDTTSKEKSQQSKSKLVGEVPSSSVEEVSKRATRSKSREIHIENVYKSKSDSLRATRSKSKETSNQSEILVTEICENNIDRIPSLADENSNDVNKEGNARPSRYKNVSESKTPKRGSNVQSVSTVDLGVNKTSTTKTAALKGDNLHISTKRIRSRSIGLEKSDVENLAIGDDTEKQSAKKTVTENVNDLDASYGKVLLSKCDDVDENDRDVKNIVQNQEEPAVKLDGETDTRETKLSKRSRSKSVYIDKSNEHIEKDASYLEKLSSKFATETETKKLSRMNKTKEINEEKKMAKEKEQHSSTKVSTEKVEDKTGTEESKSKSRSARSDGEQTKNDQQKEKESKSRTKSKSSGILDGSRKESNICEANQQSEEDLSDELSTEKDDNRREKGSKMKKQLESKSQPPEKCDKSNEQNDKDASYLEKPSTGSSTETEKKKMSRVSRIDGQNEEKKMAKQKEKHSSTKVLTEKVEDKTGTEESESKSISVRSDGDQNKNDQQKEKKFKSRTKSKSDESNANLDGSKKESKICELNQQSEKDLSDELSTEKDDSRKERGSKKKKQLDSKSQLSEKCDKSNEQNEKDASYLEKPSTGSSTETEKKKMSRVNRTDEQNEEKKMAKQKEKHSSTKMSTEKVENKTGAGESKSKRILAKSECEQKKNDQQKEKESKSRTKSKSSGILDGSRKEREICVLNQQSEKDLSKVSTEKVEDKTGTEESESKSISARSDGEQTKNDQQEEKKIKSRTKSKSDESNANLDGSKKESKICELNQQSEKDLSDELLTEKDDSRKEKGSKKKKQLDSKSQLPEKCDKSNEQNEKDASYLEKPSTGLSTETEKTKMSRVNKTKKLNEEKEIAKQKEKHSSTKVSTEEVKDKTGTGESKSKSISAKSECEQKKNDQQKEKESKSRTKSKSEILDGSRKGSKICEVNHHSEKDLSDELSIEKDDNRKEKGSKKKKQLESKSHPPEECDDQNKSKINKKGQQNEKEIPTDLPKENDKNRAELKQSKIRSQSRSKSKSVERTDDLKRTEKECKIDEIDQQKAKESSAKLSSENAVQKATDNKCETNKQLISKNESVEKNDRCESSKQHKRKEKVNSAKLSAEKSVQGKHDSESEGKESKLEKSDQQKAHKSTAESEYVEGKTKEKEFRIDKELKFRTKSAGRTDIECGKVKVNERKEKVGSEIKRSRSKSFEKNVSEKDKPKLKKLKISNDTQKNNEEKNHTKGHADISEAKNNIVESRLKRCRSKSIVDHNQTGIEPEPKRNKTDDVSKRGVDKGVISKNVKTTHSSSTLSKDKLCVETNHEISDTVESRPRRSRSKSVVAEGSYSKNKYESENEKNKFFVEENPIKVSEKTQEGDADTITEAISDDDPRKRMESKNILLEQTPSNVDSEHIDAKVKSTHELLQEIEQKPNEAISDNANFKQKKSESKEYRSSNKSGLRIYNDDRKKKKSAEKIIQKGNSEGIKKDCEQPKKAEETKPPKTELLPKLGKISIKDKLKKFNFTAAKKPENERQLKIVLQQDFNVESVQTIAPKESLSDIDMNHTKAYQKNEVYVTKSSILPNTSEIEKPELHSEEKDEYKNKEMSRDRNKDNAFESGTKKVANEQKKYDIESQNIEYNPVCEIAANILLSKIGSASRMTDSKKSKIEPDTPLNRASENVGKSKRKSVVTHQITGQDEQNIESEDVATFQESENIEAIDLSMKSNINKLPNLGVVLEDVKRYETEENALLNEHAHQDENEKLPSENRRKAKIEKQVDDDGLSRKLAKLDDSLVEVDPDIKVSQTSSKSVSPGSKDRRTVETIVSCLKENVNKSNNPLLDNIDISAMKGKISRKMKHTKEKMTTDYIENNHKEKSYSVEEKNGTGQRETREESFASGQKQEISDNVHPKSDASNTQEQNAERLRNDTTITSDNDRVTEPKKQVAITQQDIASRVSNEESKILDKISVSVPASDIISLERSKEIEQSEKQIANEEIENIVSGVTENISDTFKAEKKVDIEVEEPKKQVEITQQATASTVPDEKSNILEEISVSEPAFYTVSLEKSKEIAVPMDIEESEKQIADKGVEEIVSGVTENRSDTLKAETENKVDIELEEPKKQVEITQQVTASTVPDEESNILEEISVSEPACYTVSPEKSKEIAVSMYIEESENQTADKGVEEIVSGITENRSDTFKAETENKVDIKEPKKQVEITQQVTASKVPDEESYILEEISVSEQVSLEKSKEIAVSMDIEESENQIANEGIEKIVSGVTEHISDTFKADKKVDIEVEEPKKQVEITQQTTASKVPDEKSNILKEISVSEPAFYTVSLEKSKEIAVSMDIEESEKQIADEGVEKIVSGVTENISDTFKAEKKVDIEVEEPTKQVEITQQATASTVPDEESNILEEISVSEPACYTVSLGKSKEIAVSMDIEESENQIADKGVEEIVSGVTENSSDTFKAETENKVDIAVEEPKKQVEIAVPMYIEESEKEIANEEIENIVSGVTENLSDTFKAAEKVDTEVDKPKKQVEITQQETASTVPDEKSNILEEISVSEPAYTVFLEKSKEIAVSMDIEESEKQIADEGVEKIAPAVTENISDASKAETDENKVDIGLLEEDTLDSTEATKEATETVEATFQKEVQYSEATTSLQIEEAAYKDLEKKSVSEESTKQIDTEIVAEIDIVNVEITPEASKINYEIQKDNFEPSEITSHAAGEVVEQTVNKIPKDQSDSLESDTTPGIDTCMDQVGDLPNEYDRSKMDVSNPLLIASRPATDETSDDVHIEAEAIDEVVESSEVKHCRPELEVEIETTSSEISIEPNEKSSLTVAFDVQSDETINEVKESSEAKHLAEFQIPVEKADSEVPDTKSSEAKSISETVDNINYATSTKDEVASDTSYPSLTDKSHVVSVVPLPIVETKPNEMKSNSESVKPIRERNLTTSAGKFDEPSMHEAKEIEKNTLDKVISGLPSRSEEVTLEMETIVNLSPPCAEVTLEAMQCEDVEPESINPTSSVTTKNDTKTSISNSDLQTSIHDIGILSENSSSCDTFESVESFGNAQTAIDVVLAEEVKTGHKMFSEIIRSVKELSNSKILSNAASITVPDNMKENRKTVSCSDMTYIQAEVHSHKAHKLDSDAIESINSGISEVTSSADHESELGKNEFSEPKQSPKNLEESEQVGKIAKETSRIVPNGISDKTVRPTKSTAVNDTPNLYEYSVSSSTSSVPLLLTDGTVQDVEKDGNIVTPIIKTKPVDKLDSESVLTKTILESGRIEQEPPSFQSIPTTLSSIVSDPLLSSTNNLCQTQTSTSDPETTKVQSAVKENKQLEVYFSNSTISKEMVELPPTTEDLQSNIPKTIQSPEHTDFETVDSSAIRRSLVDVNSILNIPDELGIGKTVELVDHSESSSSQTFLETDKFPEVAIDTLINVTSMVDLDLISEFSSIVEFKCSYEEAANDHTYTNKGDPLFSGKQEESSILPSNSSKPSNDFPLNDRQMMDFSEYSSEDLNQSNTEQLSVANEYAVKNLLMLGGQPSSDTNAFHVSEYGLVDIKCMDLIDENISSTEGGTNKSSDFSNVSDSWMQYMNEENPNPCQLDTSVEVNPKVVVVPNEQCLTPTFNISTTDIMDSFSQGSTENSSSSLPLEAEPPSNSPPSSEGSRKVDTRATPPSKNSTVKPKITPSPKPKEIIMVPVRRHSRTPVAPPPKKKPPLPKDYQIKNDLKRPAKDVLQSPPCKVAKIDTNSKDVPILDVKKTSYIEATIELTKPMKQLEEKASKDKNYVPMTPTKTLYDDPSIESVYKSPKHKGKSSLSTVLDEHTGNALPNGTSENNSDTVVHQSMYDAIKSRNRNRTVNKNLMSSIDVPPRPSRQKSKRKSTASPASGKSSPLDIPADPPKPKSCASKKSEKETSNITDNLLQLKPITRTIESSPAMYSKDFLIDTILKKEPNLKLIRSSKKRSSRKSTSKRDHSSEYTSRSDSSDSSSERSDGEEREKSPRLNPADKNEIFNKLVQQGNINQNISLITQDKKLKTKVRSSSTQSHSNSHSRKRSSDSQRTTERQYRRPRRAPKAADTRPRGSHREEPPNEYQVKDHRYDSKDLPKAYQPRKSKSNSKRSKPFSSSTPSHHSQSSYPDTSNAYYHPSSRSRRHSPSRQPQSGSTASGYQSADPVRSSKKPDALKRLVEQLPRYDRVKRDDQGTSSTDGAEWHRHLDQFFGTNVSIPHMVPVRTPRRDSE